MKTTLVLVSILLILTGISYAEISLEDCAGIWLFDEGSGDVALDSSGNGNDGTLMGAPNWVEGEFGKALELNGTDDFVEVPSSDSLNITDVITVMAWVNINAQGDQGIVSKIISDGDEGVYDLGTPSGGDMWGVVLNSSWIRPFVGTVIPGDWQFVAFTYDGSDVIIYENGVQVGSTASAGTIDISDGPLVIGKYYSNSYTFNGIIDETAVFNAALTEDDISDIMGNGLASLTGVAAVYPSDKLTTTWGRIKR